MRRPPSCKSAGRAHIVAPSGTFSEERLESGLEILREAQISPVVADRVFDQARYLAGPDSARVAGVRWALRQPDLEVVWAARGGYGGARLLTELNPDEVAEAGAWLVGFSDVTALHALWARADLCSIHGANITTLDMWTAEARSELFGLLDGTVRNQRFTGTPKIEGSAEGRLLGGNLTVLGSLAGTGYLPSFDGAILMLEDISERPYRLDRTLTQLLQAGVFEGLRGVVIGQLTRCEAPGEPDYGPVDVIADVLAPLRVPIAYGFPFGHEESARAVVLGAEAVLDEQGTLTVGVPTESVN